MLEHFKVSVHPAINGVNSTSTLFVREVNGTRGWIRTTYLVLVNLTYYVLIRHIFRFERGNQPFKNKTPPEMGHERIELFRLQFAIIR